MQTRNLMIKTFLAGLCSWAMGFIMPVGHLLVLADFVTGVRAAKHRGEALRSRGFKRSIEKISLFIIAILLAHGLDVVFFTSSGVSVRTTYVVAGLICVTEFKSNMENISQVTGAPLWAKVSEYLPSIFKLPKKKDEGNL